VKKIFIFILILIQVLFAGNFWMLINIFIPNATAAIWDIWHWRDSVWGQIPGTTFAGFDFNQQIRNDGIYTKPNNSTIQLNEAWDYLVISTIRGVDNSNGRYNAQARLALTSGSWDVFSSYYTGYSRDNSENTAWFRTVWVVLNASANSQVQIQRRRDTDAPTSWSIANESDVQVIRISQSNYWLYGIWGTGNAYGWTTPNTIDVANVLAQSNIASIEWNTGSDTITLKGDNKKYLVAWSVSFVNGWARTQRIGHLEYDNVDKLSTSSYCYQRSTANEYCGIGSMDIIQTGTADINIQTEAYRWAWVWADEWGADVDGNATTDGNGQMIVLEMPDYLEAFRWEDSVWLQDVTASQTLNIARDVNFNNPLSFTKNNNSQVSVTNAADIFSWANIWTARNDINSGSRLTALGSITLDGVKQSVWEHWNYSRWNQGTQDTFALWFQPAGIYTTTWPGTTLGVSTDPLPGTEWGWTDRTQPGSVGFFALNLDTLVAPALSQSSYRFFANANSTNVWGVLAAQNTPATLTSDGEAFRLRSLINVSQNKLRQNEKNFKLQFAQKNWVCDPAFSGEIYTDVTTTSAIAFNNNATPADNSALTANTNDPVNGATPVVNQSYQELNNFTTSVAAIPKDSDGKWDFSLIDNTAPDNTSYCFRVVESDGTLLDTYSIIPEITTSVGGSCGLNDVDIIFETDTYGEDTFWSLVPDGNACGVWELDNGWNTNLNCASGGSRSAAAADGYADNSIITEWPFSLTAWNQYTLHVIDDYGDGITVGAGWTDPDIRIIQNGAETDNFSVVWNWGVFSFTVESPTGCVDTIKPDVTVNQAPTQADPSTNGSATFRAVFNEPINIATFTLWDISLTGTTWLVSSNPVEVSPNDGTTFEFTVSGMTPADTVSATIPAWWVEDLSWNTNNVSTSSDNSVTYTPIVTPGPGGIWTWLNLWLKSNVGTSTTTNNANLTTWNDQSWNGKNATAVTAPTYRNNTTDNINFYPVVNFNGTNQFMRNTTGWMSTKNYFAVVIPRNTVNAASSGAVPFGLECISGGCGLTFWGLVLGAFTAAISDEVITHALWSSANWRSSDIGASTFTADKPLLISVNENLWANGTDIYEKWVQINDVTANTYQFETNTNYSIGASNDAANRNYFNGKVAEIINFDERLSDSERVRIESYLAFKYGITLKNGTQNYIASNGSTIFWNSSTAWAYNKDIFGIGRDTTQSLAQVQSKSINDSSVLSIQAVGEGTNINPAFVDITNNEFFTVANNGEWNFWSSIDRPSWFDTLSRRWKAQEVWDVGTLNLDFNVANTNFDIPVPNSGTNYYFLADTNNNWNLADETPILMTNQGWNIWRAAGVNIGNGQIFTIATQSSINNIPTDISLSPNAINENVAANSIIGTFSTTDSDIWDSHTYSLVSGVSSTDNPFFTISGNTLRLIHSPDFEIKNSYMIRVQTNDWNWGTYQKVFTVSINNLWEATTSIIDFENPINNYKYKTTSGIWTRTTTNPFSWTSSFESGINWQANTQACFEVNHNASTPGTINFYRNVSSETNDFLRFYIDNTLIQSWSGNVPYAQFISAEQTPWLHIYKWCYIKDGATNGGTDRAYIDQIEFKTNAVDITPPTISNLNFASGSLLPGWNHTLSVSYSDIESGINTASAVRELYRWNGTDWGADISASALINGTINNTTANYTTNNLDFWKYLFVFRISDNTWNNSAIFNSVFYIDRPIFLIWDEEIDIWDLSANEQKFSSSTTLTVRTVWAPFKIFLNRNTDLTDPNGNIIQNWDGSTGYWYDITPLSGSITTITLDELIVSQWGWINQDWELNTYVYNIQIWAEVDEQQEAWDYQWNIDFKIQLDY